MNKKISTLTKVNGITAKLDIGRDLQRNEGSISPKLLALSNSLLRPFNPLLNPKTTHL